ncbi:MAG: VOC family protein [Thermoguttaceae bacterium]|jgi:catechol 2,3-dioxygenase-like lactoylglutathione lyase family enzyme
MVTNFDHVTIVVSDLEKAKHFFGLLGFEHDQSAVILGDTFSNYMGIDHIEADHVTLALPGSTPRIEVQLLKYRMPDPLSDPNITRLNKIGFNHVCFAVENLESEITRLVAKGIKLRNKLLDYHGRKLIFLCGPEGITVELSERY